MFTSIVSANENIEDTLTTKEVNQADNLQLDKQNKVETTIKEATKSGQAKQKTSTSLKTYTNGSHIIMNATVKSRNKAVNEGYVIYKLDGVTLKNNHETIKINVTKSKAILVLSVSDYKSLYKTSEAIYSGSEKYNQSRIKVNNTNIRKYNTSTTLKISNNTTHIKMKASINSELPVNNGFVIYKLNQITLKNSQNDNYKINVTDSMAELTIPISEYRRLYSNSMAVYSGSAMYSTSRTFNNQTLNYRLNPDITLKTDKTIYTQGENMSLKILLSDIETKNFTDGKVSVKINGISVRDDNDNVKIYRINGNSADINLPIPKGSKYDHINVTVSSEGRNYNQVKISEKININPLNTKIIVNKFVLDNNNYLNINATIKDKYDENIIGKRFLDCLVDNKKVRINNKSKVYTIRDGIVNLKIPLDQYSKATHKLQLKLRNDNAYMTSSTKTYTINLTKKYPTNIIIDTPKKAKNASTLNMRIYVTYDDSTILKTINEGTIKVKLNDEELKSNVKYGKAIISVKLPEKTGNYTINVNYEGQNDLRDTSAQKIITLTSESISASDSKILGNKNPSTTKLALENGIPQLIYMNNYVWADDEATYTLTKSQLQEVFKQDSYSLYLNGHLSKYVFFKTANESNVYHVLKREKWNVIEKAVNKVRVSSSKGSIPNNITVNLRGKKYTYSEARAIQSTGYTCGPTAVSVCTQTLKNYVNEHTLATQFNTYKYTGTYAKYIPPAMKKYNMSAVYYYKSNFNTALDKVAGGGYVFVFYGVNHYVSIIDVSKDKSKVLVSNSYGNYELGGGKIPNGWVSVSFMKNRFSKDTFAGLLMSLDYKLSEATKNKVNMLYNNFGSNWVRQNTNEELNV